MQKKHGTNSLFPLISIKFDMIERITKMQENNRFLGDEVEMVVHDLENENTAEPGCYIDEIFEKGNAVVFTPDTLDETHRQGCDNCEGCLGKRLRLGVRLKIEK